MMHAIAIWVGSLLVITSFTPACPQETDGTVNRPSSCISKLQPVVGDILLQASMFKNSSTAATLGVSSDAQPQPEFSVSPTFGLSNDAQPQPEFSMSPPKAAPAGPNMSKNITLWNVSVAAPDQPFIVDLKQVAVHETVAAMLLLFVGFVMTMFYLINFPDPDIQDQAWQLLSRTVCIFIAVLISKTTTQVIITEALHRTHLFANGVPDEMSAVHEPHGEVGAKAIIVAFACWICFWFMFIIYMALHRNDADNIVAVSKLGGHIVAFAGLDAFTALQAGEHPLDILRASPLNSLGSCLFFGFVMWIGLELAEACREYFVLAKSTNPEALHAWLHECREAEKEAASLIMGLLFSQTIRHAISGEHPPLHGGKPKSKDANQVFLLLLTSLLLGVVVVRLEMFLEYLSNEFQVGMKKRIWKGIRIIVDTVSMTMAWCLLYWGEWFIYNWTNDEGVGHGDRMTALLVVAGVLSSLCCAAIFLLVFAARHSFFAGRHQSGLQALSMALGLVVGCAWEDVFIEAVGGVKRLNIFGLKQSYCTILVIVILCMVTLPAWILYILPRAEQHSHGHNHGHNHGQDVNNQDEQSDISDTPRLSSIGR